MENYKKRKTYKKHQKRRRRGPGPLLKDAACKIMYYSSGIMHLRPLWRQFCSKTKENHQTNMFFTTKQPKRSRISARIRVLMLGKDRAELTDHFLNFSCKYVGWSSSSGRLKSEKNDQNHFCLNARYKKLNKSWSAVNLQVSDGNKC